VVIVIDFHAAITLPFVRRPFVFAGLRAAVNGQIRAAGPGPQIVLANSGVQHTIIFNFPTCLAAMQRARIRVRVLWS
jgi:hypothetical protein